MQSTHICEFAHCKGFSASRLSSIISTYIVSAMTLPRRSEICLCKQIGKSKGSAN